MLGVKGSGDGKKLTKEEAKKELKKKRKIRLSILVVTFSILSTLIFLGLQKSTYADFSKTKLQEFVRVWEPIEKTNDQTIESDIQRLSTETIRIKLEMTNEAAPINAQKLRSDIISFFEYANSFTSDMHKDFQWSKELSIISGEDDQAILAINFNNGSGSLKSTLKDAVAVMDNNVVKMDAMTVSAQVKQAHKDFRDSVAEESALYSRLITAVGNNDTTAINNIGTEIKVFNEKFGKMSGPSSALTIAYAIKTKEFEIKIEKLGKEIDNASNILTNNFY